MHGPVWANRASKRPRLLGRGNLRQKRRVLHECGNPAARLASRAHLPAFACGHYLLLRFLSACPPFWRPPRYDSPASTGPAIGPFPARARHACLSLCVRRCAALRLVLRSRCRWTPGARPVGRLAAQAYPYPHRGALAAVWPYAVSEPRHGGPVVVERAERLWRWQAPAFGRGRLALRF